MNNQKGIAPIIVVLTIVILFGIGILIWYLGIAKEKVEKFEEKTSEEVRKISEKVAPVTGGEEIPSEITLNDEKLKIFVINHKIQDEDLKNALIYDLQNGVAFSQIIREDLNKDEINEIIIGFGFGGPSIGWIGLIAKNGEGYKIINWEEVFPAITEMELKNIPNDRYPALVVKLAGGGGTGIFYQKMQVYNYINNQLKLTFDEYKEVYEEGAGVKIMKVYNIDFKNTDLDENIEIIQTGTETEAEWSEEKEDFVPLKVNDVINTYKWNEKEKLFIKL